MLVPTHVCTHASHILPAELSAKQLTQHIHQTDVKEHILGLLYVFSKCAKKYSKTHNVSTVHTWKSLLTLTGDVDSCLIVTGGSIAAAFPLTKGCVTALTTPLI